MMSPRRLLMLCGVAMLLAAPGSGCSSGGLDSQHDRYLNIFGLPYSTPPSHKGAVLGKVLLQDGSPAEWAQVYARSVAAPTQTPLATLANAKGGFYLANLEPGAYNIFITSPSGQGTSFATTVAADQVVENDGIPIRPLVRLSGHVTLMDEPVRTGVSVYLPGTPFSAFTDQDGYYYLDVPAGTFKVRAERETFVPFETAQLQVSGDTTIDMTLAPNPFPNGKVTVEGEAGFLVRGLTTMLHIEPESGVRDMYVNVRSSSGGVLNKNLNRWIPVTQELRLDHEGDGITYLDVTFMDAYGKQSDPIGVVYANTTLDRSWTVLYGDINGPVVIKAGDKVAFLDAPAYGQAVAVPTNPRRLRFASPTAAVAGGTTTSSESIQASVVFHDTVTVAGGATLRGAATFLGSVVMGGTKAQPVKWTIGGARVSLQGTDAQFRYLDVQNGAFEAFSCGSQRVHFSDSRLYQVELNQPQYCSNANHPTDAQLAIDHVHFDQGGIYQTCNSVATPSDPPHGHGSPAPGGVPSRLTLAIASTTLNMVGINFGCTNVAGQTDVTLTLQHNDFLAPVPGGFYFMETDPPTSGGTASGLPPATDINYDVHDNHFQEPGKLDADVATTGWPTAIFGDNVPTPHSDAGPR